MQKHHIFVYDLKLVVQLNILLENNKMDISADVISARFLAMEYA